MKTWTTLALCLVALAVLLSCSLEQTYLQFYIDGKQQELATPAGSDDTPITFTISPGDTVAIIAGNLKAKGLINDTELFRRYVQVKGLDAGIQAGSYSLRQTMTIPEIAQVLQKAAAPDQQVTIPEGRRLEEVATLAAEQAGIAPEAFLRLVQVGWVEEGWHTTYSFLASVPITATLEGFLFPDTYRLPQNPTAHDLVERMLDNFERQVTPELQQALAEHGLSLYEGLILASIVEREAVVDAERPIIAGVYHNRLRDGWPLSACPTVQYALGYRADEGTWWKRELYFVDLEVASPYNTYRNLGLPPAPIASPGLRSIEAAAHPAETSYYFFMVDCARDDGSHVFATNEAEHLENFNRCGGVITSPGN